MKCACNSTAISACVCGICLRTFSHTNRPLRRRKLNYRLPRRSRQSLAVFKSSPLIRWVVLVVLGRPFGHRLSGGKHKCPVLGAVHIVVGKYAPNSCEIQRRRVRRQKLSVTDILKSMVVLENAQIAYTFRPGLVFRLSPLWSCETSKSDAM